MFFISQNFKNKLSGISVDIRQNLQNQNRLVITLLFLDIRKAFNPFRGAVILLRKMKNGTSTFLVEF